MNLSYFYLICALTVVDIILLAAAAKHRNKKAVKSFIFLVLLIIIAHIFYGASLIIAQPNIKYMVHELKFIGVAFFTMAFYVMYMDFFDRRSLRGKYELLLVIAPAITVILAVTNNYHHLFRTHLYVLDNEYGSFVGVQSGPLFLVYILYSYSLYIFGIGVIIREYLKTPKLYRVQIGIMLFAAASTLAINFISISNLFFEDFGDATLISFTFAALIQFYGLVLYKPSGMIRLARDMAVNEIKDPIIIFDYEDRFLDANAAAREIFSLDASETAGGFLSGKLSPHTGAVGVPPGEYAVERGGMWYTVRQKRILDEDDVFSATAIMLSDITEIKSRERELENLANHDYLTGIANRHAYLRELKKIRDDDLPVAVIHFNIRGMKSINSLYGNEAGDSVIKNVAQALAAHDNGFCARLGGDEFALLLRNTSETDARVVITDIEARLPDTALVSGLAVKQSNMDNINIIDRASMDNMYMNRILAHSDYR